MNKLIFSALLAMAGLTTVPAHAQFSKPEDALKYRQSVMFLQGQHMGRINAALKAERPDLQSVAGNAATLDTLNKLFFTAFPEGSDMFANTRAKPEIWKNSARFKELADKLNTDVGRLLAAARSNDLAATRSAFSTAAGTCKSCHDDFRRD